MRIQIQNRINPLIFGQESESAIRKMEGYGLGIRIVIFFVPLRWNLNFFFTFQMQIFSLPQHSHTPWGVKLWYSFVDEMFSLFFFIAF